jgi:hypothetical protein
LLPLASAENSIFTNYDGEPSLFFVIRNLRLGQQALFAFVDVLAKTFKPSPPAKRATTGFSRAWASAWRAIPGPP